MNSRVIIGGLSIIAAAFIILLPGYVLKIMNSPVADETGLEGITAAATADSEKSESIFDSVKIPLNMLDAVTGPLFYPIIFIGFITVIVGLRVD